MMKSEFIEILREISPTRKDPTDDEYEEIEFVYTYHPSIGTKECIVKLWADFGQKIIEDMVPRCERVKDAEIKVQVMRERVREANRKLEQAEKEYNDLFK